MPTQEQSNALSPPVARTVVEGVEVVAPEGTLVAHVLSFVPKESALAWLVPASQATARTLPAGALTFFQTGRAPRQLSVQPSFVPSFAGCKADAKITRSGPASVTLDVVARCEDVALPERAPTRSLQVVMPERTEPVLQTLRLAPANEGETLEVTVSSVDQDSDGHDDVRVSFSMKREGRAEPVEAVFVWLNRAAGVAREPAEPASSFAEVGSVEAVRAKGKNTQSDVAARVETARRLMAYLCAESGNPRLSDAEGRGVECGELSLARDRLAMAEVEAHLKGGRPGDAVLAFELLHWYGGVSAATRSKLSERIGADVPFRSVGVTRVDARARDPGPSAALGPLAFAADHSLLIQTVDGVQRWRDGALMDASEEVDPWRLVVEGPGGLAWLGANLPCEKPLVEVQARAKDGAFVTLLQGRWLAPRPSVCNGATLDVPEVRPVRWDATGVGVLFGSAWLGSDRALQAPWLGSPVSANGQHWVAPTSLGLYLQHETSSELWRASDDKLQSCVIDNGGRQVACLRGKEVVLLRRNETTGAPATTAP